MQYIKLKIPEILLCSPLVHSDSRGYFFESFSASGFDAAVGRSISFVQDNHSMSKFGVLRGLHYQVEPSPQGKLVRVIKGEVFDVAVDIRENSPTFGKWVGEYLSAENKKQLWIPEGFAHGFLTLSAEAELLYKTTSSYNKDCDRTIAWNSPKFAINWPLHLINCAPILSEKDQNAPVLR